MSTVDELFETMSEPSGEINDACFIDSSTRIINVPSMYKELGVVSDEKVNRLRFVCPKIVGDNVDLTNYNLYVNYQNAAGELNAYLIDDVVIVPETQENMIAFSWLLSRHVTQAPGTVHYIICAKKSDGINTTNEWNTKVATGVVIANDIEPVKEIEEQNADVIEQILSRIDVLENGSGSSVSLGIRDAEIGKSVQIKSVDSNGQPTAWETFDTYDDIRSFLDKEGLPGYAKKTEIPTKVSELENDSGYLTEHQSLVEYAKKTEIPKVPTKVSELQNDKNYTPISLGITGATKETYLQIAAVDSDGRPTAFDTIDSWEDIDSYIARNFGNTQNNMVGDVLVISAINGENQVTSIRNLHVLSEYVAESSSEQNGYLITNAVMKAAIADVLSKLSEAVEANTAARHTHDNKAVLDSITGIVTPASNPIQKTDIVQYQVFKDVTDGIIEVIPTKVSELENDSGYLTEHQSLVEYAKKTEIPTNVSELQNDSGYLTEHQSLVEYAKKTEIPIVPESLKNPNVLTIKVGDTTTTYDGSEAKTIDVSTGESIPSYWLTHLQTKADKIREVMEAAGRNKSAFLFYTDVHWTSGEKKAPMLLKYLYNNTPINKTIFGGDIVDSESTDRDVMKYLWEWRKQVRELPNHHSVVGNHDDGNTTNNLFSTDYIYSFLLAAEENPNIVQGGDMYYYIDEPCEKTRYLYLDTAYIGINNSQTTFIKEALKTAPDNWHIVAISHIWYAPDYDQYTVRPIPIKGYGAGVESIVDLFDNYNARQGEFSSCTAKVEFCIGGHCHRDYVGRTTGGIPIILCETDSHHNRSGLTDTVGTTTESSVNAIIANYSTEKINAIRIGRGENFEVPLRASVTPPASYTNLIPTSIDTSGNIYNNSGYKAGTYINNADGLTEVDNPSHWCTGLIPIKKGDVVRIKYVFDKTTYNDDNLYYYSSLCFYNEDKSLNRFKYLKDFLNNNFISGSYEWSGTNFEGTLTFTFDGTSSMFNNAKYIRVSDTYLGSSENVQTSIKNAVITINEEIN